MTKSAMRVGFVIFVNAGGLIRNHNELKDLNDLATIWIKDIRSVYILNTKKYGALHLVKKSVAAGNTRIQIRFSFLF